MNIFLLAVPYDSGYYKKRLGVGPEVLMNRAEEALKQQKHTVTAHTLKLPDSEFPTEVTTSFEINRAISGLIKSAKADGALPIIFAGNCNTAIGTLGGLHDEAGVVWLDCHGDYNTPETSVTGYLDGMALATIAGHCWKQLATSVPGFKPVREDKIILIGARDFDQEEAKNLSHSMVELITTEMIKLQEVQSHFPEMDKVYLHIDLDVLDPQFVKVNSYATEGGLSTQELVEIVKLIKKQYAISAVGITAYDLSLDPNRQVEGIVADVLNALLH